MAKNLDELKDELYETFNDARKKIAENIELDTYSYPKNAEVAMQAAEAAAKVAQSIVQVERELADREKKKNGMKLPGKG